MALEWLDNLINRNDEDEDLNILGEIDDIENPSVEELTEDNDLGEIERVATPTDDPKELEDEMNAAEIGEDVGDETVLSDDNEIESALAGAKEDVVEAGPQQKYKDLVSQYKTLKTPTEKTQQPEVELTDLEKELGTATDTRQDELRNLAIMKAIGNMGQSAAGRFSGNFKANQDVLTGLEKVAGMDVDRIKTLLANKKKLKNTGLTDAQKLNHELQLSRLKERQDRESGKNVRFKRSQDFRETEKQEISDKQTDQLAGYDEALSLLSDAGDFKKDVDTGFATNLSDKVRTFFGTQDVGVSDLKMAIGETLSQKVKSLSGTAASDKEREFIKQISLPTINDDDDVFKAKLKRALDTIEKAKQVRIDSFKKQGKDPSAFETQQPIKQGNNQNDKALEWAKQNPEDPRAAQILKRLGL